ncbi:hypothetical protein IPF37_02570 [bacterium]|nr:MAG: hypothetical protein IPF37_02570 [bacterium]
MKTALPKSLILSFVVTLFAHDLVVGSELPTNHYYANENIPKIKADLEKIKEAATSNDMEKKINTPTVHAPCIILIEEQNQENKNDADIGAVTTSLGMAVEDAYSAIITSASVLLNMIERIDPQASSHNDQRFKDLSFKQGQWRLFSVSETGFFLLIPKKYENLYSLAGFDITKTIEFTNTLPNQSLNDYTTLKKLLGNKLKKLALNQTTLKKIIVPMTENIVRDFLIDGHGSTDGSICGTDPKNIKTFLQHLNFSQKGQSTTGFVGLFSCYSGGKNLNKIELSENNSTNVLDDYNFTLMVFSTNDDVIQETFPKTQAFIRNFFNQTAQFADKGPGLDELMKSFVKFNPHQDYSKHGTSNLPQIWLPHGKGFQTFNLGAEIEIINKVQTRIHKENNEPFVIKDKKAVLLYSNNIEIPINIISTQSINKNNRSTKHFWNELPVGTETFDHLATKQETQTIVQDNTNYPLCSQAYENIVGVRGVNRIFFPIVIPMIRENNILAFNSISLESPKSSIGILDFIRSAFFDTANYKRNAYILIKELTGINDIALTLEGLRARKKDPNQSACEIAFRPTAGKKITLKEVFILQEPAGKPSGIEFADTTQQRWLYSFDVGFIESPWNFEKTSKNHWEKYAPKEITPGQKSLTDVLNQRLTQEALSKLATALTTLKAKLTELAQTLVTLSNSKGS